MGGLHTLEEGGVPPANLSCDVVATSLLRTQAHQAHASIKAHCNFDSFLSSFYFHYLLPLLGAAGPRSPSCFITDLPLSVSAAQEPAHYLYTPSNYPSY